MSVRRDLLLARDDLWWWRAEAEACAGENNQNAQLYVPGRVKEAEITLVALGEGFTYGHPRDHEHVEVHIDYRDDGGPPGWRTRGWQESMHATTFLERYGRCTLAAQAAAGMRRIRWRPLEGQTRRGTDGRVRHVWLPWAPG